MYLSGPQGMRTNPKRNEIIYLLGKERVIWMKIHERESYSWWYNHFETWVHLFRSTSTIFFESYKRMFIECIIFIENLSNCCTTEANTVFWINIKERSHTVNLSTSSKISTSVQQTAPIKEMHKDLVNPQDHGLAESIPPPYPSYYPPYNHTILDISST